MFNIFKHDGVAKKSVIWLQSFTHNVNKAYEEISEDLDSDTYITNWARHSFSTFLKSGLIPIEVIFRGTWSFFHSDNTDILRYLEDDILEFNCQKASEI